MPRLFQGAWFGNWRDLLAELVLVGGLSIAEAWALDDVELEFWLDQAERIAAKRGGNE